ncbi:MarR family winged helix-turn-helix transcriptional regulator [Agromyces bauzanensis]|uniref:MarR family transcriptional regulator n=1 Tax=Agromyces bauzanensis TaxID=1308924 RepID=A0A917PLR1_9MICO|nr:MarR family transcriptional regulator [Agromyces bauzanensis]GGJ83498.1 MarR family transcriptional regulator [Agromyces bauzanensis]
MTDNAEELRQRVLDLRIELGILNDRVANACGLRPRDLDILDVIDREGNCTPTHLCSRTGIHGATMTGILGRLRRDGWIERIASTTDARSATVTATARTMEIRAMYAAADEKTAHLTEELSPMQRETISHFLQRVSTIARDVADHINAPRTRA